MSVAAEIPKPHATRAEFYEIVSARWPDAKTLDVDKERRCSRLLHAALRDWAWRAFMSGVTDDPASAAVRFELGTLQAYGNVSWWEDMPAQHYTDAAFSCPEDAS